MSVRIGSNPIGWSNDDMPELGATPMEQCLARARSVGIEGMGLGNKFPREPNALNAACGPSVQYAQLGHAHLTKVLRETGLRP